MAAEATLLLRANASASYEIAFDLTHRRHLVTRLRHNRRCRFDHTIPERATVGVPFESATAGDLRKVAEGQRVHLECRRGLAPPNGFGPSRMVSPDWLRARAGESLAGLGFHPQDIVRVRYPEKILLLRLGGKE
jgi:hypothetical protein